MIHNANDYLPVPGLFNAAFNSATCFLVLRSVPVVPVRLLPVAPQIVSRDDTIGFGAVAGKQMYPVEFITCIFAAFQRLLCDKAVCGGSFPIQ